MRQPLFPPVPGWFADLFKKQYFPRAAPLEASDIPTMHLHEQFRSDLERTVPADAFCTLTTLNAVNGLEAPAAILLGMDRLLESEPDLRLSAGNRAGQRLVVLRSVR
jgi:hypothetical protein